MRLGAGIMASVLAGGAASAENVFFAGMRAVVESGEPVYLLRPAGCPAEAHKVRRATSDRAELTFGLSEFSLPLLTTLHAESGTVLMATDGALTSDYTLRYRIDLATDARMLLTLTASCIGAEPPVGCQPMDSNIHTLRLSFSDPCQQGAS